MRTRKILANVGALLAVLVVAALLAEGGLRALRALGALSKTRIFDPGAAYAGGSRMSSNPRLGWELDPASSLVNSAGFRDRDYTLEPAPGVFRIAALGDSVTFGRGVPLDESFAKVLERSLNTNADGARRYEVLNFGVGGYNTVQEVELYRTKVRRYAPDLLVVVYVLNDPLSAQKALRIFRDPGPAEN